MVDGQRRGRQAEAPQQIPARGWKDVLIRTFREFKDDNISTAAAAAAFNAWLALIPAAIGAITVYGLVSSTQQITSQIDQLTNSFSSDVKSVITDPITSAANASGKGLSIGLILSLAAVVWSASGGMNGMIQAVNTAYDETDDRNFLKKRGLALLLTFGAIVTFVVAILLVAVLPPVLDALHLGAFATVTANIVRWVLLAGLVMVGLSVLYRYAPDRTNAKFRWVSWGSAIATVLWLIASAGFSVYVNNFGSYNKTYGALAGVIVLNLWLYISCLVILFGAELNSELEAQTTKDSTTGPAQPLGRRGARKADEVGPSTDSHEAKEELVADITDRPKTSDLSTGELVSQLTAQVSTLVRDELALARVELTEKGKKAGVGAGMFGGAGVLALYGLGALFATVIAALSLVLPVWAAALIVAVVLFAVAGVVALLGKKNLSQATPPVPAEAVEGVKRDVQTVKEHAHR